MATLEKTPVGELSWVFITGLGKERFNKDGYDYTASITLKSDDFGCEELKEKISDMFKAEFGTKAKAKSLGFKENEDNNTTTFSFKTGATFHDGSPQIITTFDSDGNKSDLGQTKIGNGSTGRIFFNLGTYEFGGSKGISLYLKAVQIAELSEYETLGSTTDSIEGTYKTDSVQSVEGI